MTEAKNIFYKDILSNLTESQEIEAMRIPKVMTMTPEDRAMAIMKEPYQKQSSLTRMPKGWK